MRIQTTLFLFTLCLISFTFSIKSKKASNKKLFKASLQADENSTSADSNQTPNTSANTANENVNQTANETANQTANETQQNTPNTTAEATSTANSTNNTQANETNSTNFLEDAYNKAKSLFTDDKDEEDLEEYNIELGIWGDSCDKEAESPCPSRGLGTHPGTCETTSTWIFFSTDKCWYYVKDKPIEEDDYVEVNGEKGIWGKSCETNDECQGGERGRIGSTCESKTVFLFFTTKTCFIPKNSIHLVHHHENDSDPSVHVEVTNN